MTFSFWCGHICLSNEFVLYAKCHINLFLKATIYKVSQNQIIKGSYVYKLWRFAPSETMLLLMHMVAENVPVSFVSHVVYTVHFISKERNWQQTQSLQKCTCIPQCQITVLLIVVLFLTYYSGTLTALTPCNVKCVQSSLEISTRSVLACGFPETTIVNSNFQRFQPHFLCVCAEACP